MAFETSLSGLNSASTALDVIGNNISNASTVGFKGSLATFGDIYAASLAGTPTTKTPGLGTNTTAVVQSFVQGAVSKTNNPVDVAINGKGFFRVSNGTDISYTRDGQFRFVGQLDATGKTTYSANDLAAQNLLLVNALGQHVMGYPASYAADPRGVIDKSQKAGDLLITKSMPGAATTTLSMMTNLDSSVGVPSSMTPATVSSALVAPLAITAANNSFGIRINDLSATPATPVTIDVRIATYATADALATAVQDAINKNTTIAAQGTLVDVTADNAGRLTIATRSTGSKASLDIFSITGDTGFAELIGGTSPASVQGLDHFDPNDIETYSTSTAQTIYDSAGVAHSLTMFFSKTAQPNHWQLNVTADKGTATGSVDLSTLSYPVAGGTFSIGVDGSTAVDTSLPGTYSSMTALKSGMQSAIDGAVGPNKAVVSINANNQLVVTSATAGGNSAVSLSGSLSILGSPVSTAGTQLGPFDLEFGVNGLLKNSSIPLPLGGALPTMTLNLAGSTQYGVPFAVNSATQDGYATGELEKISVSSTGVIQAAYSNAQYRNTGQLVLATFRNPNALINIGNNQWAAADSAGKEELDTPGNTGAGALGLGVVQGSAVESSNVDLGSELISLIVQQRFYQANAQAIKTQDQILQTLAGIR